MYLYNLSVKIGGNNEKGNEMFKTIQSQSKFSLRENNSINYNSYQTNDEYLAYGELSIKSMSSIYRAIFNVVYDIQDSENESNSINIKELKEIEKGIDYLVSYLKKINENDEGMSLLMDLKLSGETAETMILKTKKQIELLESKRNYLLKKMNKKNGISMTALRINIQLLEKKDAGFIELYNLKLKEKVSKYDIFLDSEKISKKEDMNDVFFKRFEKKIYDESVSLIKELTFDNEVFSF